MKERWTDLNATSDTRTTMLEEAVKLTIEYQENRSHFVPWLDEAERRVDAIHLTCDDKALETHKQHVEELQQDVENHSDTHNMLDNTAEGITKVCVEEVSSVEDDIQNIK